MAIVTNNDSIPEPEFAISPNLSPTSKRMKSSERFTQDETTSITRTMFSKELLSDAPRMKRSINDRNHSKRSFGSFTSSKKRHVQDLFLIGDSTVDINFKVDRQQRRVRLPETILSHNTIFFTPQH